MRKVILISGRIGSGKSTVCECLRNNGEIIVSVDDLMHLLYKDQVLQGTMISLFGKDIYDEYGNPTPEFKTKVISNEKAFKLIEKIIGSKLKNLIQDTISACLEYSSNERIFLECGYPERISSVLLALGSEIEQGKIINKIYRVLVEADSATRKTKVAQRWINRNKETIKDLDITNIIQKSNEYTEQFEKYQENFDIGPIDYTIKNDYTDNIKTQVEYMLNNICKENTGG